MDARLRGGIDLGGTKIQAVVVDARHAVLGSARQATPRTGGPEEVARALAACLREAAEDARVDPRALSGVGVGSPGHVNAATGTVSAASNLPDWGGTHPLGSWLGAHLGLPVALGNDVGAALDGEALLGAGRSFRSFVGLFWGTGVGGGVVLEGRRWLGRGAAGEIGHMIVRRGGAPCPCGGRGHVEAYAGRRSMEARARELAAAGRETVLFQLAEKRGRERLTSGIWEKALERGDALALELVERAVEALAAGAASAVNLLDVEAVVVGGGLGLRMGEGGLHRLREALAQHLFLPDRPPALVLSELGDLGGAIGASLLGEPRALA